MRIRDTSWIGWGLWAIGITGVAATNPQSLFARAAASFEMTSPLRHARSVGGGLETNADAMRQLADHPASMIVRGFPMADGSKDDFELQPTSPFATDAVIVTSDGKRLPSPEIAQYIGRSLSDKDREIFLSVANHRSLLALVRKAGEMVSVIEPDGGGRHVLHAAGASASGATPDCGAMSLTAPGAEPLSRQLLSESQTRSQRGPGSDTVLEAELMLDVGYGLFSNSLMQSDLPTVTAFVGNLVGAVSFIYQRDLNVVLKVNYLTIWTSPDPFATPPREQQLYDYTSWTSAYRGFVTRDIAHLLTQGASGGVAFINVLCNSSYGTGVSNILGSQSFPQFDYVSDTYLMAHEIGHNFAALHTHCYIPPVDRCYVEPGCYNGPTIAQEGEIMTYCTQRRLFFGGVIAGQMRLASEAAACLSVASARCGNHIVDGGEQCDDGNVIDDDCCSNTCTAQNIGVDCSDGLNCTRSDACDADGVCTGTPDVSFCSDHNACTTDECLPLRGCVYTPGPPASCRSALKSALTLNDSGDASRDKVTWKWTGSHPTTAVEFADPTATTMYGFCVMDGYGTPVIGSEVAADPLRWSAKSSRGAITGYSYKATTGIKKLSLRAGDAGKTKVGVSGKGSPLGLSRNAPPLVEPLRVFVVNSDTGSCWEDQYSGATILKNEAGKVKAKSP